MKKLLAISALIFTTSTAFAGNSENWNLLVAELRTYVALYNHEVVSIKATLNEDNSDLTTAEMQSKLDVLYRMAKTISFQPYFSNGKFYYHQETLKAIQELKIELELWKEFSEIKLATALPSGATTQNVTRNIPLQAGENPRHNRFTEATKYSNLQKDIYRVSKNSETRLQKCIEKENSQIRARLDNIAAQEENHFTELESYEKATQSAIAYAYKAERYAALLKAFRQLEELLATIK